MVRNVLVGFSTRCGISKLMSKKDVRSARNLLVICNSMLCDRQGLELSKVKFAQRMWHTVVMESRLRVFHHQKRRAFVRHTKEKRLTFFGLSGALRTYRSLSGGLCSKENE